jgi:hypothetical protein
MWVKILKPHISAYISVPDIYVNPIYSLSYVPDYGSFEMHVTDVPEIESARGLSVIF